MGEGLKSVLLERLRAEWPQSRWEIAFCLQPCLRVMIYQHLRDGPVEELVVIGFRHDPGFGGFKVWAAHRLTDHARPARLQFSERLGLAELWGRSDDETIKRLMLANFYEAAQRILFVWTSDQYNEVMLPG